MKPSLRAVLIQSIRDYVELRDKVQPEYDQLVAAAPDGAKVIMAELNARGAKLDAVWAQAMPEMNVLEARRYALMIGKDMPQPAQPAAQAVPKGEITDYPEEFKEAVARIKKVFPSARVVAYAKEGEALAAPKVEYKIDVPREYRPSTDEAVKGIPREEPKPIAPEPKPEQLGLI